MPHTEDSDIPRLVRRLLHEAETAEQENRKAEALRLRFLVGDQWEDSEKGDRRNQSRPFITINECEAPVNKVVNELSNNPPGPEIHPVGGGADEDTADIIAGMLRQIEYDSMAVQSTYVPATRYVTAAGRAVLEWGTDWANNINGEQKVVIKPLDDPALYFCDPSARRMGRTDATWRIKLKSLSRDAYINLYGADRKVIQVAKYKQWVGDVTNYIGFPGELASINQWTGGGSGPYWVAEFWQLKSEEKKLDLYSNGLWYREDQTPPDGAVKRKTDDAGGVVSRTVTDNKVTKYMCDACELIGEKVEWIGDEIPIIDVLGPEIYIEGKLHRISMIADMIDPQRALNNASSNVIEVTGLIPLSPMMGAEGQFVDPKWATLNTQVHAYLEYRPVLMASEAQTGASTWAPPPSRNLWNASIDWLMNVAEFFRRKLQDTSQTYDESLGKNRGDQSGEAVRALQAQSQMGNYQYIYAVTTGVELMYGQILKVMTKVYDTAQAMTILRADNQPEIVQINKEFAHPNGDKNPDGSVKTIKYDLSIGQYSVRAKSGPSFLTRQDAALDRISMFLKNNPAAAQNPAVLAAYLRLLGEGNPKIEQIADIISPPPDSTVTPEQMQAKLVQSQQQLQQLMQAIQALEAEKAAKIPEIQSKERIAAGSDAVKLAVAQIGAKSQDAARLAADKLTIMQMAHEVGTQAADHEQAQNQQASDQQHQAQMPAVNAAAQPELQEAGAQ